MVRVTLRALDGADKGRVYNSVDTPVTIGREEGNTIQLNDERISRYHVKIQEDHDQLVLTDLQSTNGTRVNGEDLQLRNLRYGDLIQIGRTILVFGSREQITQRLHEISRDRDSSQGRNCERVREKISKSPDEMPWKDCDDLQEMLFYLEPPELPERLSPGQSAQLAEVFEYVLISIRHLLTSVQEERSGETVRLDAARWQNLIDIQCRLAEYLRRIGDPDDPLGPVG